MRLPRVRLRTLMIAVAVVGVALALGLRTRMLILANQYRALAQLHAAREANLRASMRWFANAPAYPSRDTGRTVYFKPGSKDLLVQWVAPPLQLDHLVKSSPASRRSPGRSAALTVYSRRLSYESAMRRKYEWLSRHPWESPTPDPPPPP